MQNKLYIDIAKYSKTLGANAGGVIHLADLYSLIQGMISGDGAQAQISNISFKITVMTTDGIADGTSIYTPVVTQCAPSQFTEQLNLSQRVVGDMIDQAFADDFGFEILTREPKTASNQGISVSTFLRKGEGKFILPRRIINLLNKEMNTERLQNLYLTLVIVAAQAGDVYIEVSYTVSFREERKQVIIR